MPPLEEILREKDNDYSRLARVFKIKTKLDIVKDGYNKKIPLNKSCSIIIPFYRNSSHFLKETLISLWHQDLSTDFKKNKVEIIIINDGSPINPKRLIEKTKKFYPVVYLRLKRNYGRAGAAATNLGLSYAKNEIIIFLNDDIVVPKDFVASHLLRHQFLNKCIIVGFRHNITLREFYSKLNKNKQYIKTLPSYKEDFRYKKFIPNEWKNTFKNLPSSHFNRTCYLLNESNYFKNFGKGKIIGVWDLPFMFLACNASVPRKYVIEVGGFDLRFKGWGCEDTHLGAKLIARGLYLIPNLHATVYHLIEEKTFEKEKRKKYIQFKRNFYLYQKLKNENLFLFSESEWREKMKKYFKSKFKLEFLSN